MTDLIQYYNELNPILDAEERGKIEAAYKTWVEQQPSCIDGDEQVSKPHHVRIATNSGTGIKPPEIWSVPVTYKQHTKAHASGTLRTMKDLLLSKLPELHEQFLNEHTEIRAKVQTFRAIKKFNLRKGKNA